jgi:methyl-accepting chemotaxis protein
MFALHKRSFRQMLSLFIALIMAMFVLSNAVNFYMSYLQEQALAERREEIYKLADMREVVASLGFASREMAHQVLATNAEELREQQDDANDKHQRLLTGVQVFQQRSFLPEEAKIIMELNERIASFSGNFKKVLALAMANPLDDAAALQVVDASEEEEDRVLDLANAFMQQANAHIDELTDYLDWLHTVLVVCMLSFAGLGVLTCVVMVRVLQGYMQRIGGAVTQVQENYTQVEQHVREVTVTVQNEETSVKQIAVAMEEFAKTVNHITQRIADTAHSTTTISGMVEQAQVAMKDLEDRSQQITHVLKVITGVADQINLLALNAAIEAARAGEAGRGFAVVADEVRKLAQHTNNSTGEIDQSLKTLQAGVQQLGQALSEIRLAVSQIEAQSGEVSTATHQQQASMQQINTSVGNFSQTMVAVSFNMQATQAATASMGQGCAQLQAQLSRG